MRRYWKCEGCDEKCFHSAIEASNYVCRFATENVICYTDYQEITKEEFISEIIDTSQ